MKGNEEAGFVESGEGFLCYRWHIHPIQGIKVARANSTTPNKYLMKPS